MKWNLYGHDWAVDILQKHIQNDSVRHAYLLSGTPGIGRRSLAIKFAQAINCLQPPEPGNACGVCRICKQTEKLQLPDLSIVQLEEDKNEIRIEQIRELQKSLSLTPYEAKYRIALIINFHLANSNAQNALLKTLEEAPPKVILLITADAVENLLPTISSRCEILRLRPVPITEMELLLKDHWKLDQQTANELAHLTSGRIGLAKSFMSDLQNQELIHDLMNDCIKIFNFQLVERFQYIDKLTSSRKRGETKETVRQILEIWLLFWRDILLHKSGCSSMVTFVMFSAMSIQASSGLSFEEINTITKKLEESLSLLEANINIRLLLENLMMKWPAISIR
jgi:DNA polymerase-3 subunit delta'